ncbi:hypothetical protein [Bradyrhizobium sp. CCBAU 21360]|nr:hypothetical protein [Bradyrhizobium sp. CCBAU 21360]
MGALKVLLRTLAANGFVAELVKILWRDGVARPAGELDSGPVDGRV